MPLFWNKLDVGKRLGLLWLEADPVRMIDELGYLTNNNALCTVKDRGRCRRGPSAWTRTNIHSGKQPHAQPITE